MRQADIFLQSEGDAWFRRNHARLGERDPVFDAIVDIGIKPKSVLEVGCANGWRLAKLRDQYQCEVTGIEPSEKASGQAMAAGIHTMRMTAEKSASFGECFDLVIYGFCLYLTDPADWFRIVAAGDTDLAPGGHLIVHDFADGIGAYARRYEHHDKILSYHFDFADLWLGHPLYTLVRRTVGDHDMVTVLRKRHFDFEVKP